MLSIFKKRKWSKWQDVTLITSSGRYYLLQVKECELTGIKKYRRSGLGWVNDYKNIQDIVNKTNIKN